jgi:hypothetical protein
MTFKKSLAAVLIVAPLFFLYSGIAFAQENYV